MNYSIRRSPLCTGYEFSFSLLCQKEESWPLFFCLYFPLLDNYYQAEELNIVSIYVGLTDLELTM